MNRFEIFNFDMINKKIQTQKFKHRNANQKQQTIKKMIKRNLKHVKLRDEL